MIWTVTVEFIIISQGNLLEPTLMFHRYLNNSFFYKYLSRCRTFSNPAFNSSKIHRPSFSGYSHSSKRPLFAFALSLYLPYNINMQEQQKNDAILPS